MKLKRLLALLLSAVLLSGCTSAQRPTASSVPPSAVDPPKAEGPVPYIAIPEQYRAWDESGVREHVREGEGEQGIVSSLKYEASYIGSEIMVRGGNAMDAAIAVSFALSVCEPYDSGLGGGGMATYYDADTGETIFLNFRETTPALQTSLASEEEGMRYPLYLQIGTPGLVWGLYWLWERYGSLPWDRLVEPAIKLAREGYQVTPSLLGAIDQIYSEIAGDPELSSIYLKDDLPPQLGDVIQNEPMARLLEQIAQEGPAAFYCGETAQAVVSSAQAAGSPLSLEDLEGYQPYQEPPAAGDYRGYKIVSSPYGGGCIIEALNLLELLPVLPHNSIKQLSQMAEVQKQVFADRAKYMGDSRFVDLPLAGLTSKEYALQLVEASDFGAVEDRLAGEPWPFGTEEENTTGFVAADPKGNVIALTQTLNGYWGSRVYVEGYGFFLNNELNDFDYEEGRVNSLEPGKAPLSSMSPTIIFREDGSPYMALSAPGGLMIWPALVQVIQNRIDYDTSLDEALNTPRICTNGEFFYCDVDLDTNVFPWLEDLGYTGLAAKFSIARPAGLLFREDGGLEGSAERRGDAAAINDCAALGH